MAPCYQRAARHQVILSPGLVCEDGKCKVGTMTGGVRTFRVHRASISPSVIQLLVPLKDVVNVANEALLPHFIDDVVLAHVPVYL